MEHIPDHRNKAANCLSWLTFTTRKRNDNPLKDEDVSIHETKVEVGEDCCPLCEVDLTHSKPCKSDNYCIRIAKLPEGPRSRFHERDSYGYDDIGLLYHINRENGKEYEAMVNPKTLIKLSSRRCMNTLVILVLGKLIP